MAFAALLHRPLHVINARARRPKPGLRPQHLSAVRACADLCAAETEGLALGSGEFSFRPGASIRGGRFSWDIGTAGSTTMLALALLPLAAFAEAPLDVRIQGGVFQDFAPSPLHMRHVLLPNSRLAPPLWPLSCSNVPICRLTAAKSVKPEGFPSTTSWISSFGTGNTLSSQYCITQRATRHSRKVCSTGFGVGD